MGDKAGLAFSGTVILAFIITHLLQFKFGVWYDYVSKMDVMVLSESGLETVPKGTAMRDIFKLEKEVFGKPVNAWGYVAAISVLGLHLWWGWSKTVQKMERNQMLKKEQTSSAEALGRLFVALITAGFISQPLYVLYGMEH